MITLKLFVKQEEDEDESEIDAKLMTLECLTPALEEQFMNVVRILELAQFPSVLKFYRFERIVERGVPVIKVWIERLREREIAIDTKANVHLVLCGIAFAFAHLHSQEIVFCTLTRSDIGLNENNEPILSGFRNAMQLRGRVMQVDIDDCLEYCAPELIAVKEFGPPVDVWSFGMIMYELVYKKIVNNRFAASIRSGNRPELPKTPYYELLMKCWNLNPKNRPKFIEIIQTLTNKSIFGEILNPRVREYLDRFEDLEPIGLPKFIPSDYKIVNVEKDIQIVENEERKCFVIKELTVAREELDEYQALVSFDCPSVITYQGMAIIKRERHFGVSLIRPFYPLGLVVDHLNRLTPIQIHIISDGVAQGLHFLHENQMFHGRLSESTVLLNDEYEPVIIGFPLSQTAQKNRNANGNEDVVALGHLIWTLVLRKVLMNGDPRPRDRLYATLIDQCFNAPGGNRMTALQVAEYLKGPLFMSALKKEAEVFAKYAKSFGDELDQSWTQN
jgi:serine/threonine protein kinase